MIRYDYDLLVTYKLKKNKNGFSLSITKYFKLLNVPFVENFGEKCRVCTSSYMNKVCRNAGIHGVFRIKNRCISSTLKDIRYFVNKFCCISFLKDISHELELGFNFIENSTQNCDTFVSFNLPLDAKIICFSVDLSNV